MYRFYRAEEDYR